MIALPIVILLVATLAMGAKNQWARGRTYKSGTGWCFWRWTDVDSKYIVRLHVVKTPWCAVCVHWILTPDAEPYLHDHPVTFLSLILRGWYTEERLVGAFGQLELRRHRWWNFIRARRDDKHCIIRVPSGGATTLCLMGPKRQEWGFTVNGEWVYWKDYYAKQRAEKAAQKETLK